MPTGSKGKKRPADGIGNAACVMRTETDEVECKPEEPKPEKDAAAVELGKRGGAARGRRLTPEQRQEIARKGAVQRWKKPG
jgi:hypothetical protein